MACFSTGKTYRLQTSDIRFPITGSGNAYQLSQHKDLLRVVINYFGHNEGSSWREVTYRYQPKKRGFGIVSNKAGTTPVVYDGQPYPMSTPGTPKMIAGR